MLTGYRSYPAHQITAPGRTLDLGDGNGPQPYTGSYKLGFTATDDTPPAPSELRDGPVSTGTIDLGEWMVWLSFNGLIEPIGWIRIEP